MASESLKELFNDHLNPLPVEDAPETENLICLYFTYGQKKYWSEIAVIKEIIDFPAIIPLPVESDFVLGVFNLRGNVVPIIDPERYFIAIQAEHKSKAAKVFSTMKLRVIVFEWGTGVTVALPVTEVGKSELDQQEANFIGGFTRINGNPFQKLDIKSIVEERL